MPDTDNDYDGFYRKFNITYADGRPGPDYPWFVLCYARDPHARKALAAYADSCHFELPGLAADLRAEIAKYE